jgi:hypothetical protein
MAENGGHLARSIPLTLWLFAIGQAIAIIIWGARLSERVVDLEEINAAHAGFIERFVRTERDVYFLMGEIDELHSRVDILENRTTDNTPASR